jgi:hypothetical protein
MAALIDVSETVRHRLQCPIELSRIVNAAEQRRISWGDERMSHIFNDRSDKSADGLRRHQKNFRATPGPLATGWPPPHTT